MSQGKLFMVNMHIDTSDIRRRLGALERKANLVMAHAANGGVPVAVKFLKKEAAERYRLLQRDVTKTVSIKKALRGHPYAVITSRGEHIGLEKFTVTPFRPLRFTTRKNRSPHVYKAAVMKGQGLKPLNGNPKPFVAVLKNGHKGVFVRKDVSRHNKGEYRRGTGKEKYSNFIKSVQAPAIPQMLKNEDILEIVNRETNEAMVKCVGKEIDAILEKTGK